MSLSSTDLTAQARRLHRWSSRAVLAIVSIAALVVGPLWGGLALGAPAPTFSDGTFNNADWTAPPNYKIFDTTPAASGMFTAFQVATGGSPLSPSYGTDAYRRVTHDFDGPGGVVFAHLKFAAIYDPATQGAIQHVDFAFDVNIFDFGGSFAVGYSGLIRQNGSFYIKSPVISDSIENRWVHFDIPGLTAADFTKIGSFGTGGPTPDFSSSGAPIQFGYATTNGSCCPGHIHTDSGIDNWAVFVTPVPVNSTTTGVSCTPSSVMVGTSPGDGQIEKS
ncbi:MAG TPA: hypothetical protein VKQ30_01275 [Ktedonobacterales bacterium]|nr:hypothetical protein [Ktedonobacterales bacterium]